MRKGITNLLREYYRLKSRTEYEGDYDTAIILADLMSVINGSALTPRQRQFVALHYFVGLKLDEIATITSTTQYNVANTLRKALDRLVDASEGNHSFYAYKVEEYAETSEVYKWLNGIANGHPVEEPTRKVVLSIAELLRSSDEASAEMVRQHEMGEVLIEEMDDGKVEYSHYSDSQLRWLDRRVTLVEEVFPTGDVIGSKRHTPTSDYDGFGSEEEDDYLSYTVRTTGRKKLYKLRGV